MIPTQRKAMVKAVRDPEGESGPAPSPSYQGPLDLVDGAVVAYGVVALSDAMRGEPLLRLRRSSDDAEQDWPADAVTGDLDAAAIATWRDAAGAADLFVVTLYDQSGNAKHAIGAGDGIPFSLDNDDPCLTGGGVAATSATPSNVASGAVTTFMVAKGPANFNLDDGNGDSFLNMYCGASASLYLYVNDPMQEAGADFTGGSNAALSVFDATADNDSREFMQDGTALTVGTPYSDASAIATITGPADVRPNSAELYAIILYDGAKSRTANRAWLADRFGITLA